MKPRIAASHYLNSAPLIWSFLHGQDKDHVELRDAVPAECAQLLSSSAADVALVPVIEYQRIPNLQVVPDVCVGSRKRVRSVLLVTNQRDLRDVRSVALDESSRTSATLIKIIFEEFLRTEPLWHPAAPNLPAMLRGNDAALIIGDPAMNFEREGLYVFDLATLWHELTGHGFVFAMWMTRPESKGRLAGIDFAAVRDFGLHRIEEIVRAYEPVIALSHDELTEYLTENISYSVDANMREGLELYFELAHKRSLIPELKPLRFLSEKEFN